MIKKTIIIFLLFLSIIALSGCNEILQEIFGESAADDLTSLFNAAESAIKEEFSKAAESTNPEEQTISSKLEGMMNGTDYNELYKTDTTYTGEHASEQCKGFAKDVFNELFGYNIGSTKGNNYELSYNSSKTNYVGSVTGISKNSSSDEDRLKALFSQGRPGDFVQMQRHHGGPHSAILVSVSSDGVVFFEANLHGNNDISKKSYTWAELCESNANMSLYSAIDYKAK